MSEAQMDVSELTRTLRAAVAMLGHHLTGTSSRDVLHRATVIVMTYRPRTDGRGVSATVAVSDQQQAAYPEVMSFTVNKLLAAIVPADVLADADKVHRQILRSGPLDVELVGGAHDGQVMAAGVDMDGWPPALLDLPVRLPQVWHWAEVAPTKTAPVDTYRRGFVDPVRMHWMYTLEKA